MNTNTDPTKNETPYYTLDQIRSMSAEELRPAFRDVRNCWRTRSLFEETCEDPAKYPPIFTLKDSDTSSCVSLMRLYLAMEDPQEYAFAETCLGGWDHWMAICESWKLKPYVAHMRELLEAKLRSKYLNRIKEIADNGEGPVALNATKYLLETATSIKGTAKRGRPTKQEKDGALLQAVRDSDTLRADAARLGITVVQ